MAKRKRSNLIFTVCLLAYAVIFLIFTAIGLQHLWDYMEAYERSRPKHCIDSYMEQLTPEYICDRSSDLFSQVDASLQTEADCRRVIAEFLSGGVSCVKNLSASSDDMLVYHLTCGTTRIGEVTLVPAGEAVYGLSPWTVSGDSFDLSFLLTPGITITVPSDYPVYVNGILLSDVHAAESGIHYPLLEEFYDSYSLPTLVTYRTGTSLGPVTVSVTDPEGSAVSISGDTDWDSLLSGCPGDEAEQLRQITDAFIRDYVDFTSCTNNDTYTNYERLAEHMVPGGALAKRMYNAINGLYWVTDRGAQITAIDITACVSLGDGRYLCDVTYRVNTRDHSGSVQAESRVKIIFAETQSGLKAESMVSC